MRRSPFTTRRVVGALVVILCAFAVYDYVTYHSRFDAAMAVVSRQGGRAGSLLDWPFGRECRIAFDRPLTHEELHDLSVLNSLSGRHSVGVVFNCELDDSQLQAARDMLSQCRVFQPDARAGDP